MGGWEGQKPKKSRAAAATAAGTSTLSTSEMAADSTTLPTALQSAAPASMRPALSAAAPGGGRRRPSPRKRQSRGRENARPPRKQAKLPATLCARSRRSGAGGFGAPTLPAATRAGGALNLPGPARFGVLLQRASRGSLPRNPPRSAPPSPRQEIQGDSRRFKERQGPPTLFLLCGSLREATLLPTTSASPSPPHSTLSARSPAGLCRQASAAVAACTRPYSSGPRSSSLASPLRCRRGAGGGRGGAGLGGVGRV